MVTRFYPPFFSFIIRLSSLRWDEVVDISTLTCVVVFNVTDQDGNKITDEGILDYIQKVS